MPGVVVPAVSAPDQFAWMAIVPKPVTAAVAAPLLQLDPEVPDVAAVQLSTEVVVGVLPGVPTTTPHVTDWPRLV